MGHNSSYYNLLKIILTLTLILAGPVYLDINPAKASEGKITTPENYDKENDDANVIKDSKIHKVYQYIPDSFRYRSTEKMISAISKKAAGKVYYNLKDEGGKHFTARVAVVAAVPLSDLKRETEFGRLMAEYLLTDLADRGIKVTELRLGKEINILAQTGEFILSRNLGELAEIERELDYVLVSTFSNTRKTLIVQGRLVNLKTGFIKTSWRDTLPINRELLNLFQEPSKPHTITVKEMRK